MSKLEKTFVILYGSQKAGTTWLHRTLDQSEQFFGGHVKEWRFWPIYFSSPRAQAKHITELEAKLASTKEKKRAHLQRLPAYADPEGFLKQITEQALERPNARILADFSPATGFRCTQNIPEIQQLMHGYGFDTKALWLIRDPVSRLLSSMTMQMKGGTLGHRDMTDKDPDQDYIRHVLENAAQGLLFNQTRIDLIWDELMGLDVPAQVHHFDDLFSQSSVDQVTAFLGMESVPPFEQNPNKGHELFVSDDNKRFVARELAPTYRFFVNKMGSEWLPESWRQSMAYL